MTSGKAKKIRSSIKKLEIELDSVNKDVKLLEKNAYHLKDEIKEARINFYSFFTLGIIGATLINLFTNVIHEFLRSTLKSNSYQFVLSATLVIFIIFAYKKFYKLIIDPIEIERKKILDQLENKKSFLNKIKIKSTKLEKENNKLKNNL